MTKANFLLSAINISSICFRLDASEALYPVLLPGFQHVAIHPNHRFAASLFGTKEVDLGEGQVTSCIPDNLEGFTSIHPFWNKVVKARTVKR